MCWILAVLACHNPIHSGPPTTNSASARALLRQQAERTFATATLSFPPSAHTPADERDFAPLIVQEVRPQAGGGFSANAFGEVTMSDDGFLEVNVSNPVVYTSESRALLGGRLHTQRTYVWFHPGSASPTRGNDRALAQGVRMTVGADGFPVIWEILSPASVNRFPGGQLRAIYVSQSLEQAARTRFGPPSPACMFSAERTSRRTRDVVIIKVLEDGPMPLGPYVYEAAKDFGITTLLCRCSPQQVDRFIESSYYDLRPMDEIRPWARWFGDEAERWVTPDAKSSKRSCLPLDQTVRWPYGKATEH